MDFPIFSIEPVLPDGINLYFGATENKKKLLSGFTQENRRKVSKTVRRSECVVDEREKGIFDF